jgi:hypothetical protein
MGWWSTDIMGGDTPLDFEDQFYDICKVEKFPEGGGMATLTKKDLESNLSEILAFLNENRWGESQIGFQVLAVLMLKAGARIDLPVKVRMIEACHLDDWSHENAEREITVGGLLKAIETYDNKTPIIIKSRGLFEVMAEKLGTQNS